MPGAAASLVALLLPAVGLGARWPTNDTSCHTGSGLIYGMHFTGFEIESVDAKDYGECCAACGAQQTSPKPGQQKCTWIEWNPNMCASLPSRRRAPRRRANRHEPHRTVAPTAC